MCRYLIFVIFSSVSMKKGLLHNLLLNTNERKRVIRCEHYFKMLNWDQSSDITTSFIVFVARYLAKHNRDNMYKWKCLQVWYLFKELLKK